jgi:hypothetical protein
MTPNTPEDVIAKLHKWANHYGGLVEHDLERAISLLQQRPFSEELRQAMLEGAKLFRTFTVHLTEDHPWAKHAALLTRAAEGEET